MINLQINPFSIQQTLVQYGVLGLVAFVLGYFAWNSYKKLVDRNDALEKKVDTLQIEVRTLLVEERDRMQRLKETS